MYGGRMQKENARSGARPVPGPRQVSAVEAMPVDPWPRFRAWNARLAESFLSPASAGRPVYLDKDSADFTAAAKAMGVDLTTAVDDLCRAVAATIDEDEGSSMLRTHEQLTRTWRLGALRSRDSGKAITLPPPSVALLAVMSIAAEDMGHVDGHAPHAYYPRLARRLGHVSGDHHALISACRSSTEQMWQSLNDYLTWNDGRLGLPSAYALGHRFVGLPVSQALLREADREKLPDFFVASGLAAGSDVVAADMQNLLEAWVQSPTSTATAHLKRLAAGKTVERLAEVLTLELLEWDGDTTSASASAPGAAVSHLRLSAHLRKRLGKRRLELAFVARVPDPAGTRELKVASSGSGAVMPVVAAPGSRVRPARALDLDPASLIGTRVELTTPDGLALVRQPRRVVPFRRDELLGTLVEVDRLQLMEDAVVLVKDVPPLIKQVRELLDKTGRYEAVYRALGDDVDGLDGLPSGWVVFDGVQVFTASDTTRLHLDARSLVPLASAQLTVAGGLQMPGRVRRWSSVVPPEVRAVVDEPGFEVALHRTDDISAPKKVVQTWTSSSTVLTVPLTDADLEDGDYELSLTVTGARSPLAQRGLRLRSAKTPDTAHLLDERLVRDMSTPAGVLSARPARGGEDADVPGPVPRELVIREAGRRITWDGARPAASQVRAPFVLGRDDPTSCVVTGAHRIQVETAAHGSTHVEGVCGGCGLVKRYPTRMRRRRDAKDVAAVETLEFADVRPRTSPAPQLLSEALVDAVVHLQGGSVGAFERLTSQIESTSLYTSEMLRTLETVGLVDVCRGPDHRAERWQVRPPSLAQTSGGDFRLVGGWSPSLRTRLASAVESEGHRLGRHPDQDLGWTYSVRQQTLIEARQAVDATGAGDWTVVENAAVRLLDQLPRLSEVKASLHRTPLPSYRRATKFHPSSASWAGTPGIAGPGAYRLEQDFSILDVYVDEEGSRERSCLRVDVRLSKHLAALETGQSLTAYLPNTETFLVAQGADLPGLYGRVLHLCNGEMPQSVPKRRALVHTDIPASVAHRLATLLST